jgi:hypothetical protein
MSSSGCSAAAIPRCWSRQWQRYVHSLRSGVEANLNPLQALRSRLCSGQWEQSWPSIQQQRRVRQARHAVEQPPTGASPRRPASPKRVIDGRPTAQYPWHGHRGIFAA